MGSKVKYFVIIALLTGAMVLLVGGGAHSPKVENCIFVDSVPAIKPDYAGVTIAPNIAPMNFAVLERAKEYYVKIHCENSPAIEIVSKSADIIIPQKSWQRLLSSNKNKSLYIDVYTKNESKQWRKFKTITNTIAAEPIDNYITYRNIPPVHGTWDNMSTVQRDLTNFKTKTIFTNDYFVRGCMNCHNFCNNNADKMTLAIRSELFGSSTLLIDGKKVHNLNVKFTYSTWHPTGDIIAFSINKVGQFFNFAEDEVRNVVDLNSMLAYYNLKTKKIKTIPAFSKKDMLETYPAFSADGKYLYYSSARRYWSDDEKLPPNRYDSVKYNLMRASYDIEKDSWGSPEMVVSAKETQKSVLEARVSPNGRWLLFCMCDYGCFPVYRPSSDLYLIDLEKAKETGVFTPEKISANSDKSESWHSFSSNSKWIAFSSKSLKSRLTVTKFCYLDDDGQTSKPFVMPQKEPSFYDSFTMTFSVPEFTTTPIKVTREKIGKVVRSAKKTPLDLPITMATPGKDSPWSSRE